jgi:TatD DNase family protein
VLIDSHCHLDYLTREGRLDEALDRARRAGVGRMVTICTKVTRFDEIRAIAEAHDDIWCTLGIHPHSAGEEPPVTAAELARLAKHPKVIGIGESGLDYHYMNSPMDDQIRSFREHIKASRETGLPLIVHTREADDHTIDILREEYAMGAFPGLLHCFSTARPVAEAALDLGLYISISGIVTFKASEELRRIVADVPLDRLLVETDAPYLAPEPHRGRKNEPAHMVHTAKKVAEIKGISPDELAEATTENFFRLFARAKPPESGVGLGR